MRESLPGIGDFAIALLDGLDKTASILGLSGAGELRVLVLHNTMND